MKFSVTFSIGYKWITFHNKNKLILFKQAHPYAYFSFIYDQLLVSFAGAVVCFYIFYLSLFDENVQGLRILYGQVLLEDLAIDQTSHIYSHVLLYKFSFF